MVRPFLKVRGKTLVIRHSICRCGHALMRLVRLIIRARALCGSSWFVAIADLSRLIYPHWTELQVYVLCQKVGEVVGKLRTATSHSFIARVGLTSVLTDMQAFWIQTSWKAAMVTGKFRSVDTVSLIHCHTTKLVSTIHTFSSANEG